MRERIHGWLTPRTAAWFAAAVWAVMLLGVFGRVVFSPPHKQSVVPIYLAAGQNWRAGQPLYQLLPGIDLYRNPPGVAVLFAPLSLLPDKPAAIIWRLVCVGVFALGIRRLIRDLLPPLSSWQTCGVWVLSAVLVLPAFNNGQINLIIVGSALCGITAAARGKWWEAAAWLAGCGWLKIYTFAVGMLACVVAPRQLSWRLVVCSAVLFALPFACQSPGYVFDRHIEFVKEISVDDRSVAKMVRAPRDWTIIPRSAFDTSVPRVIAVATALVAAAAFAHSVWLRRSQSRTALLLALALGLVWLTLFGPFTEMNTYSVLAPAVAVVVAGRLGVAPVGRWAAWGATGCLLAAIVRAGFGGEGELNLPAVQAVGAVLLLVALDRWVKAGEVGAGGNQRNGRDLNPRYGDTVYGISSAASSASRAPFRVPIRRRRAVFGSPQNTSYRRGTG